MAHPVGSPTAALSPHVGLIHPTLSNVSRSAASAPGVPSSPLPCMFAPEEPARKNSAPPSPSPAAALTCPAPAPRRSFSSGSLTGGNGGLKKFKIYYCQSMSNLAGQLVKLDDRFVLEEIRWDHFADGFPNLFIQGAESVKNYHVCFLANFHSPAVFFEQFSIITALPKLLPKSFKLFLPFFPTGTMERVTRLGEVATANSLARILSTIPVCSKGPAQICIFDIHALQNQFKDTVLIRLGTCVNLLLDRIASLPDRANVNICFPDDGAAKRFGDMFSERAYPGRIICHKVRDGDKRVVKLKEGDVQGRHCVIVDDLVQSGGTLLECAKELLRNGAECVSAYVTHAIFPKESWRKFVRPAPPSHSGNVGSTEAATAAPAASSSSAASDSLASAAPSASSTTTSPPLHRTASNPEHGHFRYFWLTDSNPAVAEQLRGQYPFEVLSVANNICRIILDEE